MSSPFFLYTPTASKQNQSTSIYLNTHSHTPTVEQNHQVQVDDSADAASNVAGVQVRGMGGWMDGWVGGWMDGWTNGLGGVCARLRYTRIHSNKYAHTIHQPHNQNYHHLQDLAAGDVHVLKYRVVRPLLLSEDVELI